jgi:hypothetical protein
MTNNWHLVFCSRTPESTIIMIHLFEMAIAQESETPGGWNHADIKRFLCVANASGTAKPFS